MTQDEIVKMARVCGFYAPNYSSMDPALIRFFHMAQAAEREACANLCEQFQKDYVYTADLAGAVAAIKHRMADAIRARGEA